MDKVFKALSDTTRRLLLDRLHEDNGQTLGGLCAGLEMSRQAATQHLALLEAANLVTTVKRGREKLHYLNPVPIHALQERWIGKFDRPRLAALGALKQKAESAMTTPHTAKPDFVYTTYIEATLQKVWQALTDADITAAYWGHHNVSDWRPGSPWEHRRTDGSGVADVTGTVVEATEPTRLVVTWASPGDERPEGPSTVTFDLKPLGGTVQLTVTHENLRDDAERRQAAGGWSAVLSNLKTYLETGKLLPLPAWS
ncbi:SRPBCC domain-containing protein [Streptomyces sp. NPDC047071]|uniref:ArsR/SmtB family transcription factor n=1 Tax=Streptomyces sp. NPDC047071 TaxID=3154808 RepID=UPI003452F041